MNDLDILQSHIGTLTTKSPVLINILFVDYKKKYQITKNWEIGDKLVS